MKMNKRILKPFLIGLLFFTIVACSSNIQGEAEDIMWTLGTSGSGSTPYIMGGVLSDVVNKYLDGLKIFPQVTSGFEANISLIAKQTIPIAQASSDVVIKGYAKYPDIRYLFNFQMCPIHILVNAKDNFNSIEDLKGKRINTGAPGQSTKRIATAILEAYGLQSGDYKVASLKTSESTDALKDGQIDAAIIIANIPMPNIASVAVTRKIDLLPLEGPNADKFNETIGFLTVPSTIPAGTYKGVDKDVRVLSFPIMIIVHKDLDTDLVYQFTKSFWDNLNELKAMHSGFGSLELDVSAIRGREDVPIHPGAEKYFKEVGVIK
jgi:TRAP transporter TAXI family solute receptor